MTSDLGSTGGGRARPLWQRMRALARAGHGHAAALDAAADALEVAVGRIDVEGSAATRATLRAALEAHRRAKLAWWRATGEQA